MDNDKPGLPPKDEVLKTGFLFVVKDCNGMDRVSLDGAFAGCQMNITRLRFALCLSLILAAVSTAYAADLILNNVPVKVFFSPNGGCTQAIIDEINGAKAEILVQAYSFTSMKLAKALVEAHRRGVKVEAIIDKGRSKEQFTSAVHLTNERVPTYIDGNHAIAHNKVMIIDGTTVITGSFNFSTKAEEKNAENLVILRSEDMAKLYKDNWDRHKEHSEVLAPRY